MTSRTQKNKQLQEEITKQERKEKYSKILFFLLKFFFILLFVVFLFFLLFRYVGNSGFIIKEYGLSYENLPSSFSGTKIVHFSDLHYGNYLSMEKVKELFANIKKLRPDILIFTGDLIDNDYALTEEESEFFIQELNAIETSIGKFSVRGENDNSAYEKIMSNTDFIPLDGTEQLVYYQDKTPILISGIDTFHTEEKISFPYFEEENADPNIFHIVLSHKPDAIDQIDSSNSVNLMLAGHSHNGQIVLPYIGGIFQKEGATHYNQPYYRVNGCDLYISSGIGSSPYPYRFLNPPSINFYRLRRTK